MDIIVRMSFLPRSTSAPALPEVATPSNLIHGHRAIDAGFDAGLTLY
jgi:hypothetical protein